MKYLLEGQKTERLLFRRIEPSDFKEWVQFFRNPITSKHWISAIESPEIECQKWYEYQNYRYENNLGGMNALIEIETQRLVGHCGLLVQTVDNIEELEVGYSLLPEFWKRGFAIESARKCKEFAFGNELTDSLISIISLTNQPSVRVAIKNGMKIEKQTEYKGNKVNIFRINRSGWTKPTTKD